MFLKGNHLLTLHERAIWGEYHIPSLSFCVFKWEGRLSLVCMQYTSRVWMPPPQRAVWLARLLSCWLSKGSTWHSVHSVVLHPYLDEENQRVVEMYTQENVSPLFSDFLVKLKLQTVSSGSSTDSQSDADSVSLASLSSTGTALEGLNAECACFNCKY